MTRENRKSIFLVDELVAYSAKTTGQAARHFGHGKESCHLIVAGSLEDLHQFAEKIGLKREWFQKNASWPHYDLTPSKRTLAIHHGAIECGAIQEAKARISVRRRVNQLRSEGKVDHVNTREEALEFMSRMLRDYFNDDGTINNLAMT